MPTNTVVCSECNTVLALRVCKSAAGFYLGYICPKDGPYDRESGYFKHESDARGVLTNLVGGPTGGVNG
jgi:hypothetical protein